MREVPAVIPVMTGSGLDRSCLESSCYSIRLEGSCDASRLIFLKDICARICQLEHLRSAWMPLKLLLCSGSLLHCV